MCIFPCNRDNGQCELTQGMGSAVLCVSQELKPEECRRGTHERLLFICNRYYFTKPRLSFVALRRSSCHPDACDMRLLFGQDKYGPRFFVVCGFWVLGCNVTVQLALQLQQERIQVVRSNKVVRRL